VFIFKGDLQSSAKAKHAGTEVVGLDAYPASLERSKAFAAEWAGKEAMAGFGRPCETLTDLPLFNGNHSNLESLRPS
jgi:D-serine deaminase-like pyridoxal phosphate-dependent protein